MNIFMKSYFFLIQILMIRNISGSTQYECGTHGRFEYCIDEIPGCIIGCHCHPGYYFDTDTKICEPNSKLIEHHRRHNIAPTRVQVPVVSQQDVNSEPTPSRNPVDTEIDEISKDADNLGDWLYNQFFKTIENQVINSTNEEKIPSRRSGRNLQMKMPKRERKKPKRKKPSKKRSKKEHLKRKLMRISEDHSLFDMSSSDSNSDSSDSSSSDGSASGESDEHEHKKIVMFRKKPRHPLPSFIFLPNMDTPFYPPLGLPPPPIVPMYPVVPVPPMLPVYPIPATACPEEKDKAESTSTHSTTQSIATTAKQMTEHEDTLPTNDLDPTDPSDTTNPTETPSQLRHKTKKRKKIHPMAQNQEKRLEQLRHQDLKSIARQKLLHQLREKINGSPSKQLPYPWMQPDNLPMELNQMPVPDTLMMNENAIPEEFPYNANGGQSNPVSEATLPDSPGFKYISELIHRVKINNSGDLPPIEYNPADSLEVYKPHRKDKKLAELNTPLDINRRFNKPSNRNDEDSYFSNLGRQIATLIRKNDIENRQVDGSNQGYVHSPYFDNSPRSFWERSVRSPLSVFKSEKKQFEYLKKSNELLFDIENKVEILASTSRSLNLQEIENIVKMMETAKRKIQNKGNTRHKNIHASDKNFNVNLWPKELHRSVNSIRTSAIPLATNTEVKENFKNQSIRNNKSNHTNISFGETHGLKMQNIQKILGWQNKEKQGNNMNHILRIKRPQQDIINRNFENRLDLGTRRVLESRGLQDLALTPNHPSRLGLNPVLPLQNDGNRYLSTNKELRYPKTLSILNKPYQQSSYFRQEMSLFDFVT